jgi:plastocyanin
MEHSRRRILSRIIILFLSFGWLLSSHPIMAGPPEGTAQGKVTFEGKTRLPGMKLSEVVVSIEDFTYSNDSANGKELAATNGAVLNQKDLAFTPRVLPILAGTEVSFRNDDKVFHNIRSKSPAYQFNFGQISSSKAANVRKVKFDKPGVVPVDCDVHSEMHAFILIKPNPFFALADEKGLFSLQHLPVGKYKIQAWHEKFEPVVKEITITEGQATTVELNLGKKK